MTFAIAKCTINENPEDKFDSLRRSKTEEDGSDTYAESGVAWEYITSLKFKIRKGILNANAPINS